MKLLRSLFMLMASIVLLPLIIIVKIIFLAYVIYSCAKIDDLKRSFEVWSRYLQAGIQMNLDFIKNVL